ncbi:NAD(P)H-dependent oxidoreductase [Dysgonomonas sp. ZJ709]|uniref:NAD(P)H-dependent oxidoreductase n=1 Tax=Dysgonomonas sp. ZJ709 TaxID=2709797 RepID=UPI0021033FAD|nr:NAD(P)H-dependent oxidoreductase [Dysgonomonas sp. ZJ709]
MNILIINGHPDKESFNHALQQAYKEGALSFGHKIKEITMSDMDFSPNLQQGYRKRTNLEPDLLDAWEKIKWAEHMVWIYPTWWGGMPAIMKGFIDRLFLPGLTYEYQEKSSIPKKLLKGKTSEIITTMDAPIWYYKYIMGNTGVKMLKIGILAFCGVKNKRVTYLSIVKSSTENQRNKWLSKVKTISKSLR